MSLFILTAQTLMRNKLKESTTSTQGLFLNTPEGHERHFSKLKAVPWSWVGRPNVCVRPAQISPSGLRHAAPELPALSSSEVALGLA